MAFISYQAEKCGWRLVETIKATPLGPRQESFLQLWNGGSSTTNGVGGNSSGHGAPTDVAGQWTRCTYPVKHGGAITLYVNDFMVYQSTTAMTPPFLNAGANTHITLGRLACKEVLVSDEATWQLSDVILYKRVLTPREVYDYGAGGEPQGAVGRWKLDGDLSNSIPGNATGVHQADEIGRAVFKDVSALV